MYVVPLCKTAIVMAAKPELLLKLRQVSRNMRNRVKMVIKHKTVKIFKFNKLALNLNNWVSQGNQKGIKLPANLILNKGVSNYIVGNQAQIDALQAANSKLRCYLKLLEPVKPVSFEKLAFVHVTKKNYPYYLNVKLNQVKEMLCAGLFSEELEKILDNSNSIETLMIQHTSLENFDFSSKKIQKMFLTEVKLVNPVKLPYSLNSLSIVYCSNFILLRPNKVTELLLAKTDGLTKEIRDWFCLIKGLKLVRFDCDLKECLDFLPKSIRKIRNHSDQQHSELNPADFKQKFPFLTEVDAKISISLANALNLRKIYSFYGFEDVMEKLTVRPRKVEINSSNSIFVEEHPELLEKVEHLVISAYFFNLESLSDQTKKLSIRSSTRIGAFLN